MELNCDPCDTTHKVTQGEAEKIIYALMIEQADAKAYGMTRSPGIDAGRPEAFMECPKELLRMATYRSQLGEPVGEMVLRRQDRLYRKRRAEAKETA
jgi:hypothetical protein